MLGVLSCLDGRGTVSLSAAATATRAAEPSARRDLTRNEHSSEPSRSWLRRVRDSDKMVVPIRIPPRYHQNVSTQIAVRLPDEIVAFLDDEVRKHRATSRASLVLRALERERRRQTAARDAEILSGATSEHDLSSLARHTVNRQSTGLT